MDHSEPQYETLTSQATLEEEDPSQLMMSRLNWMTYLKVLFDKLTKQIIEEHLSGNY
jgi:hypothetical protein